ncbi:MAG: DegT/DnrJ/EryC1/StrS family aminotransferase [Sphaerochaetaceae bacterium]
MIIRLEKPTLRRKEMDGVLQTMADELIGVGQQGKVFVETFKEYLNIKGKGVALRSSFDALYYALLSLDLKEGSVVGISALSPYWYEKVIQRCSLKSKIYDVESDSWNIDIESITDKGNLDALILYEPYGNLAQKSLFVDFGKPIIEDITHTIGCSSQESSAGEIGDIVICSFDYNSVVSTGGGAIIVTKSEQHTSNLDSLVEEILPQIALSDLNSALGEIQFETLKQNLEQRRALFERFQKALMRTKHSLFNTYNLDYFTNGDSFVVIMEAKVDQAEKFALKYEVETALAFPKTVIFDQKENYEEFANALPVINRALRFPIYPFLSKNQIEQIERVIAHLP